MEEDFIEKGRFEPGEERPSRALKRKAELLGVVFGLPKPDIASTSVKNMPEEFSLPKEMERSINLILTEGDSNEVEYLVLGDIKKGKLFLGEPNRGKETAAVFPDENSFLWRFKELTGRGRVWIHSHYERVQPRIGFSSGDVAIYLLDPNITVFTLIWIAQNRRNYEILMAIKGRENLMGGWKRYLDWLGWTRDNYKHYSYVVERLGETSQDWGLQRRSEALFGRNGCCLYYGKGHSTDYNYRNMMVHKRSPAGAIEFEQDLRTKLMLPKV